MINRIMKKRMNRRLIPILLVLMLLLLSCSDKNPSVSATGEQGQSADTVSDVSDTPGTPQESSPDTDDGSAESDGEDTDAYTDRVDDTDGTGNEGNTPDIPVQPPAPHESTVSLVMVGDVLMHDPVIESGKTAAGYDYSHLFDRLASHFESADIAMLNQEVIIAGSSYGIEGYPRFNAPLELADAIARAGFDVVLHATNHTLDKGKDAMLTCLDYWEAEHPTVEIAGMHDSAQDAQVISVIEKNGIRIAVLNYTYGVNPAGQGALDKDPYLVDVLSEQRVRADCELAQGMADIVVAAVHWGNEYTHTPSGSQRRWAELFLECGVDLVLGTHPHVLQPIEWLEGEDGHRMLVYWSLGNYVNCTAERGTGKGARMLGAMARVEITRDSDGDAYIRSAGALPIITHIEDGMGGISVYSFEDYSAELLGESKLSDIDPTADLEYCNGVFDSMLGSFWTRQE